MGEVKQTQQYQIRQHSARCHWNRENMLLTRFDIPIKSEMLFDSEKTDPLSCVTD